MVVWISVDYNYILKFCILRVIVDNHGIIQSYTERTSDKNPERSRLWIRWLAGKPNCKINKYFEKCLDFHSLC